MSQANVDRLSECTEAFNRLADGDVFDREAANAWIGFHASDVRIEPQQAVLEGEYVGHDGLLQWLADLAQHYRSGHLAFTDVRDLEDRVLGLGTLGVTGRASGIEIEVPVAIVATFRDGLIAHLKDYGEHDLALEAVGMAEFPSDWDEIPNSSRPGGKESE